jgi:hypothetical protein
LEKENLQNFIDKLKIASGNSMEYMNEDEYVNFDNNLNTSGILQFEEIVKAVMCENKYYCRSHKKKNKKSENFDSESSDDSIFNLKRKKLD